MMTPVGYRGPLLFTLLVLTMGWAVMLPLWIMVGGEPVYGDASAATAPGETDQAETGQVGAEPSAGAVAPDHPAALVQLLLLQAFPAIMMMTPAVAAWITMRWTHRTRFRPMLGELGLVGKRGRFHPLVAAMIWSGVGVAGTIVLVMASIGVAIAGGFLDFDAGMPLLAASAEEAGMPVEVLLLIQLVAIPIAAVVPNGIFAAGEEIGWRGYLLPRLVTQMGVPAAVVVSGIIWGIWHAPVILLGYNYARPDVSGVVFMVVGCISIGAWFAWLRIGGGSVWPAVFAHGALNAAAGLYLVVAAHPPIAWLASPVGVAGWVVFGVVAVVLLSASARRSRV